LFNILLKEAEKLELPIKILLTNKEVELSYGRNIGLKNSGGEIVAFIDDDALPYANWSKTIIKDFLDNDNVHAIVGDVTPKWIGSEPAWFPKELLWMISCSYVLTPKKKTFVERGFGTNMIFRKRLFSEIGNFDERFGVGSNGWLGGDETEFFLRMKKKGKNILFDPAVKVKHKIKSERIRIQNILYRAFAGGLSVYNLKRYTKNYNLRNAQEGRFIKHLIKFFFPQELRKIFTQGLRYSPKALIYVTLATLSELLGYLFGIIRREKVKKTSKNSSPQVIAFYANKYPYK